MQHICLHLCSWLAGELAEEMKKKKCHRVERNVVVCMYEGFFFFRISFVFFLQNVYRSGMKMDQKEAEPTGTQSDGLHMAQTFLSSLHGLVTEIDSNKLRQDKRRRVGGGGGGRIFHHQRSSRSAIKSKTSPELEDKQQPARAHN